MNDISLIKDQLHKFDKLPGKMMRKFSHQHRGFSADNHIDLLMDGENAFPAMLKDISNARRLILMESYIFREDNIGTQFILEFIEAAKRGVQIMLHFDGFGCYQLKKNTINRLEHFGISVQIFHPITARWDSWSYLTKRNHRKILIIDNHISFIGGINIGEEYLSQKKNGFHDIHIRIIGTASLYLTAKFYALWHRHKLHKRWSNKLLFKKELADRSEQTYLSKLKTQQKKNVYDNLAETLPKSRTRIKIIGNQFFFKRFVIRNAYRRLIRSAQKEINIINPYFIPDRWMVSGLYRAVKRGVKVRLILPRKNDVKIVGWAMRNLYDRLLRHGVEIYEWRSGFIHAKVAVIDEKKSIVGSFNLDRISLIKNLEIIALIEDKTFGKKLSAQFQKDLLRCHPLSLQKWRKRPRWIRILEKLAFFFRWWL